MQAPRADRMDEARRLAVAAAVVAATLAVAAPAAIAWRSLGTRAEVRALGGALVAAPLFVRAGRPADARLAPGDPPLPSPVDLLLRAPDRP